MTPGPTGRQEPVPGWGAPLLGEKTTPPEEHPELPTDKNPIPDQDLAKSKIKSLSPEELAKPQTGRVNESGDPWVGNDGVFDWYQDRDTGRQYTYMPSAQHWREKRFYMGDRAWTDGWQNLSTATNEAMENTFTKGDGLNLPKFFTTNEIANMPLEWKKYWLEQNRYFGVSTADDRTTSILDNGAEAIRRFEKLKDMVNATDDYGDKTSWGQLFVHDLTKTAETLQGIERENPGPYPFLAGVLPGSVGSDYGNLGTGITLKSGYSDKGQPSGIGVGNLAGAAGRFLQYGLGLREHPNAVDMAGEVGQLGRNLAAPGLEPVAYREQPASSGVQIGGQTIIGPMSFPTQLSMGAHGAGADPLEIPAIKYITQAGSKEEKLRRINEIEGQLKRYYMSEFDNANLKRHLVMGEHPQTGMDHVQNNLDLQNGKTLEFPESENDYKRNGVPVNPHSTEPNKPPTEKGVPIYSSDVTAKTPAPPGTFRDIIDPTFIRATRPTQEQAAASNLRRIDDPEERLGLRTGTHYMAVDPKDGRLKEWIKR
jgi:hypothetical protein